MIDKLQNSPLVMLLALTLSAVAGLCPVSRRPGVLRKNVICLAGTVSFFLLFFALDVLLIDTSNASTTLEPVFCFLAGFLFAWLVLRLLPSESVFVTVWAQILSELMTQFLFASLNLFSELPVLLRIGLYFLGCLFLYLLSRLFLFGMLTKDGEYRMNAKKAALAIGFLIVFLILSNYQVIFWMLGPEGERSGAIIPVFRLVTGISILLALYLQNAIELRIAAQREADMMYRMQQEREEQFRLSSENIALINRKCHDLKHQIEALRAMRDQSEIDRQITEMERAVMIYDSAVKTGNPALDVVLTEKLLFCEANDINMTCLIDGKSLDFVEIIDLYSMFGNALDNAIESVMKEKDVQKRVIQMSGYREKGFFLIRVRNYCGAPPALIDGLPATSKEDNGYHGFGIKSIRTTAEKYGGEITIETGINYFSLQILLPLPADREELFAS